MSPWPQTTDKKTTRKEVTKFIAIGTNRVQRRSLEQGVTYMEWFGVTPQLKSKADGLAPGQSGWTAFQGERRGYWGVFRWEGAEQMGASMRRPLGWSQ